MSEWLEMSLGDFVSLQRGHDLPERERIPGSIPVYGSAGINGFHNVARAKGPGVVVGRSGASFGVTNFAPCDYWPHNAVLYVTDFKGNDERFAYYLLKSIDFSSYNSGSAQPSLNRNFIYTIKIRVPSPQAQRKIASILSAYDDLIENNTRRIKILEEMARMVYREWFVNFHFPGHEQVKMVDSSLGMIPEGWEVKPLGDIAHELRRGINPEEVSPDTPYFGLEHLPRRSLALTEWGKAEEVQSSKLSFKKGEILFGKIRPYFHKVGVAPVDGICSTDTIVIAAKGREYFPLVLGCVSSDDFVSHATKTSQGTKMPRADLKVLVKYPVVIPPKQVLMQYNNLIDNALGLIQNLATRNRNLRQTRDLLLPKLISGEVAV